MGYIMKKKEVKENKKLKLLGKVLTAILYISMPFIACRILNLISYALR